MSSQEHDHSSTRFDIRQTTGRDRDQHDRSSDQPPAEAPDDFDKGPPNRTATISLAVGVGLMVLVIMLPYLGGG